MKPRLAIVTTVVFFTQPLFAQLPRVSPARSKNALAVVATLNKDLNTKKLKSGDKISVQVVQDVVLNGRIVLPRKSELFGRVVEVDAVTKTNPESRLVIVFELGRLKHNHTLKLHGVIRAVGPPLVDPALEAIMASSSPYDPDQPGARANGSVTPSQITMDPREASGPRAIERREEALDSASNPEHQGPGRNGALGTNSRGIFGLPGLAISSNSPLPVLISVGKNVELKRGSQIVISLESVSSSGT